MTIELLLLAAEFIERRERESEHGYACVSSTYTARPRSRHNSVHHRTVSSSSSSTSSSTSSLTSNKRHRLKRSAAHSSSFAGASRSAHNELEKNRRAHMRYCMEQLKKVVPLGSDSSKHTTLGLLTKARRLIKSLQDEGTVQSRILQSERQTERSLRKQIRQFYSEDFSPYWYPSDECSEAPSPLTVLSSPASENEPIDVIGFGKKSERLNSTSDGDDQSQVSSDSGCVLSPRTRLAMDGL